MSFVAISVSSCGIAGSVSQSPPPNVTVTIAPKTASVLLGATQQFQAAVSGSSNTNVSWQVNGIAGGNSSVGTIAVTAPGAATYTAPAILPSPASVTVTAISQADSSASDSASVSLSDDIAITVTPPTATVPTGGEQVYTATVSGLGSAAAGVTWSVNGVAGGNATVGSIASTGATTALYSAPAVPPNPATVTIAAASVADSSKSGNASATITCSATNSISPPSANVGLDQTQTFLASFCLAAGSAITWDVNGVVGGNPSVGTIASTGQATALYTAPTDLPATNPVTIHATVPVTGPTAAATVTVTSAVSVSVSPPAATLTVGQRATFTPTVVNTSDTTVTWSVNGIANGNASFGQVCQTGSNPCVSPTGAAAGSIDYLAPQSAPATNPVILTATSNADASRSGSATIDIAGTNVPVAVAISPTYAFIAPSSGGASTQQFFANVSGSANISVSWSVQSAVAGQGCAGAACGSVDANGLYTAPSAAPSPNAICVIATSQADPTKSASATLAVTSGPTIEVILPSSVMAGAVEAFPLEVDGVNFVAGSGSAASVILLNGVQRSTTCASTTACTTSLNPSDVQSNGTLTVQVQNPGVPTQLSNPVPFVIVPFDVSVGTISLSSAQPIAAGEDIIVAEPTTAAESAPINVNFIGYLSGGNTCGAQGSPLTVTRPASGSAITSICVQGNNLDPTFTYQFTGPDAPPSGSDIGVTASAITGLFPGMIELDLEISNATVPGARTLIITTPNNDSAIATGMLEVQ
ncbi:MAG TPA: hypothetical protein VEI08_03285 [Candidatus Bathyarchaeia archaeon]|nr:hypothetical protein [Candidatus Bathyarchaeia archaeon]